jgi:hypothetical protein
MRVVSVQNICYMIRSNFFAIMEGVFPGFTQLLTRRGWKLIIIIITRRRNPIGFFAGGMESTTGYCPPVWDLLLALA